MLRHYLNLFLLKISCSNINLSKIFKGIRFSAFSTRVVMKYFGSAQEKKIMINQTKNHLISKHIVIILLPWNLNSICFPLPSFFLVKQFLRVSWRMWTPLSFAYRVSKIFGRLISCNHRSTCSWSSSRMLSILANQRILKTATASLITSISISRKRYAR